MRKILLYIAASMDNFIAKTDGDTAWLHSPELMLPNEDYGYQELLNSVDVTLMGNKTYQQIMGFDIPFPYPDTTNYVLTRTPQKATKDVVFVSEDLSDFVRKLKSSSGKNIWLIGGGEVNTQLMNTGLVDQIILSVIPVLLGSGIPLFSTGLNEQRLNLTSTKHYDSGLVQLTYDVPSSTV